MNIRANTVPTDLKSQVYRLPYDTICDFVPALGDRTSNYNELRRRLFELHLPASVAATSFPQSIANFFLDCCAIPSRSKNVKC
jgi:hypothetical protein